MAEKNPEKTYILSEKNQPKLRHEGHLYWKEKVGPINTYWKCEKVYSYKCKGRAKTCESDFSASGLEVSVSGEHNHAGDAASHEAQIVRTV